MAVTVQQHQIGEGVVIMVAVPVMGFEGVI